MSQFESNIRVLSFHQMSKCAANGVLGAGDTLVFL